jgi:hypothetical protein
MTKNKYHRQLMLTEVFVPINYSYTFLANPLLGLGLCSLAILFCRYRQEEQAEAQQIPCLA